MAFVSPSLALPVSQAHRHLRTNYGPSVSRKRVLNHRAPTCTAAPLPSQRVESFLARTRDGGSSLAQRLAAADAAYARMRSGDRSLGSKDVLEVHRGRAPESSIEKWIQCDVVVAGGTLGVFVARALGMAGFKVVVVERGMLVGRDQEWNVSRDELATLGKMGLMDEESLEECIVSEWNPSRIVLQREEGCEPDEVLVRDVLNCGVSPRKLVAVLKNRFEDTGGLVLERTAIESVDVYDDAVVCRGHPSAVQVAGALGAGGGGVAGESDAGEGCRDITEIRARLFVDCMGSFSQIAAQARGHAVPDGVCVTVGACCEGLFDPTSASTGDLLAAIDPVSASTGQQSFWEAFPAAGGDTRAGKLRRTSYMFQYGKCDSTRPSLTETLDEYLEALPRYQGVDVDELAPVRVLFGFFPAYRNSPLRTPYDRVFFAGDAGGCQSPVSFGGFASMLRHLPRITSALSSALTADELSSSKLAWAAPYMPNQAATWLFASAMSATSADIPLLGPYGINRVLSANMRAMARLGEDVQRPFLQDVVQAGGLARTLGSMVASEPLLAVQMLPHVGIAEIGAFSFNFLAMLFYAVAARATEGPTPPVQEAKRQAGGGLADMSAERGWYWGRLVEAFQYGSGRDHGM